MKKRSTIKSSGQNADRILDQFVRGKLTWFVEMDAEVVVHKLPYKFVYHAQHLNSLHKIVGCFLLGTDKSSTNQSHMLLSVYDIVVGTESFFGTNRALPLTVTHSGARLLLLLFETLCMKCPWARIAKDERPWRLTAVAKSQVAVLRYTSWVGQRSANIFTSPLYPGIWERIHKLPPGGGKHGKVVVGPFWHLEF